MASRELAFRLAGPSPVQPSDPNGSTPIEEQRVYLDASLSMRGFVNSQHHSRFDELLDELGDALPGCRLYKYGQAGDRAPVNASELITPVGFGRELHESAFYGLRYNPDDRLIDKLANEDRPVLSVLITDGVYSEPAGGASPPVVNAIQRWLQKGRVLGIFTFKSAFYGPYYSERGRTTLPAFPVRDRPFYAFVFSPTERALKDLQEKLQRHFPEMQTIRFADDAISCTPNLNRRLKGTYSFREPPVAPYHWQMFDSEIFIAGKPAVITFTVKCTVASDYPVSELSFTLLPEYHRWVKGTFQKAESVLPGFVADPPNQKHIPIDTKEQAGGSGPTADSIQSDFVVHLPRDSNSDYGFYHFKLIATAHELRPELGESSTRDDRDTRDAGKTYRFLELVSAIADLHFKNSLATKTATAIFVTLDNH